MTDDYEGKTVTESYVNKPSVTESRNKWFVAKRNPTEPNNLSGMTNSQQSVTV